MKHFLFRRKSSIGKIYILAGLFAGLLLSGCNNKPVGPALEKTVIVLRFDLDSTGGITDSLVIKQLTELAAHIDSTADRIVLASYTEKLASKDEELKLATQLATAAKQVMLNTGHERVYYNVGIDAKGYANPVDEKNPNSIFNRRIEIEMELP